MNNYTIKLTVLLMTYNVMSVGGEQQNGFWSRLYNKLPFVGSQSFHIGGAAIEDLNKLKDAIKEDVQEIIKDIAQKQAEEFCSNAATGVLSKLTPEKQQEIGLNIGKGIMNSITPEKQAEIGHNIGENVTKGATYGIFSGPACAIRDGVVAHPYLTATVITTGALTVAYYKWRPLTDQEKEQAQIEKDKRQAQIREAASIVRVDMFADEYRTCLNSHAYDHGASCDEKIQRCHSPARKLAMENKKRAAKITKAYREYA